MDHSFGYNASSRPDDFLARSDLLWSFVDMVSKNGNLLLNVGPRGVDAQIPDEQRTRLAWLGAWIGPNRDAIRATRPWVRAGDTTTEGVGVRYTARDEDVFAIVERPAPVLTFPDLVATPTTGVADVTGAEVPWSATPDGLRVDVGSAPAMGDDPAAFRFRDVTAGPAT
jgi:alpha-L-fucosidase